MDRINEFYTRALSEEASAKELARILGTTPVSDATDEMLEQIGALAGKLGYEISAGEARDYLNSKDESENGELADDELDAIAGGKGETIELVEYICAVGGQAEVDKDNFGDKAKQVSHVYKK